MARANDDEFRFKEWRENKLNTLKYNRIICLLFCGRSVNDIAKEIKVTPRTIERYFHENAFNENITQVINLTFKKALGEAALFADRAVQILIEISEDATQPAKYRLQAIGLLFKVCADVYQQPEPETLQRKLDKSYSMILAIRNVNYLMGEAKREGISTEKLVWAELYPNEPFPDDESFKQWFEDPNKPNY